MLCQFYLCHFGVHCLPSCSYLSCNTIVMVVYRIAFIRQSEAKFVICLSKWSKAYREKQRRASLAGGAGGALEAFPSYKIWLSHENIRIATEEEVVLRLR